jgi:hypothetical protein
MNNHKIRHDTSIYDSQRIPTSLREPLHVLLSEAKNLSHLLALSPLINRHFPLLVILSVAKNLSEKRRPVSFFASEGQTLWKSLDTKERFFATLRMTDHH